MSLQSSSHWYVDRVAWQLIGLRYLPWLTGFSLAWEIAQLPLYTLWREAPVSRIAFSVAHCTLGDALIGTSALVLALILTRAAEPARWRWMRIPVLTAVLAVAYTAFSEWLNTTILRSWSYSELMPVLRGAGIELGLAPLAQWMLLPPLVLRIVRPRF